jgi:hypothetical protein
MSKLRELMTKEIAFYSWLDYVYERGDYEARSFPTYKSWLESLSDDEFLSRYNDVRDRINDLD